MSRDAHHMLDSKLAYAVTDLGPQRAVTDERQRTSRLRRAIKEIDLSASNGCLTDTRLPTQTTTRQSGESASAARASALDVRE